MFRRLAVIVVTALSLAACSSPFGAPSSAPTAVSSPGPAVTGTAPATRSGAAVRVESTGQEESSPLLTPDSAAASCPAACERGFRICMDSVAARPNTPEQFGASSRPFTDTDNCQYDLGRCLRRCPASASASP